MTEQIEAIRVAVTPSGPLITMSQFGLTGVDVQKIRARLDLFDETIYMTRYDDTGVPLSCFEISPSALAAAFAGLPIASGLLPADTLFYSRSGDQERAAIFVPAGVRTLVSDTRKTPYRIPLPPLIWLGQGAAYRCFAVKQRPGVDDRLYVCPTPNVYKDGRVCPGNVPFPVCSVRTIKDAFKLFVESQFNAHLVGEKSNKHGEDVMKLWRELQGAAEFPLDDLVSSGLKMSDLLEGKEAK
jgi:PRTRC genetic system protein B